MNINTVKTSVLKWLKKTVMQLVYLSLCFLYGANSAVAEQMIQLKGYTQTNLTITGNITDISTQTVVGKNAFNAFSKFDVHQGKTVNLHVPGSAQNLLNLVYDKKTNIDGTLNAYKNGQIGGNVYFANPHGLVVGKSGSVNVGSLTVSTPTEQFMDGFFDGAGNPSAIATQQLINGNAPLNSNAKVDINGQVNVQQSAQIRAGYINISGGIHNATPEKIVNLAGQQQAIQIKEENGEIILFASSDIEITGALHADGADNIDGGKIDVRAAGNIHLSQNAKLTAKGSGVNSDGGDVIVFADTDASIHDNATLDASSTDTGDGGFVEFSAKKTVELAGGNLLASAEEGQAGAVLIDPENITISTDLLRNDAQGTGSGINWNAGSLTLEADKKITVNEDIVISTRSVSVSGGQSAKDAHINNQSTADSGDLALTAQKIDLKTGSKLLANADNGYSAGDITLTAVDDASSPVFGSLEDQTAQIDISNAELKGHNIIVSASANDAYVWDTGSAAADVTLNWLDNLSVFADVTISKADAIINLDGGTVISAQGIVDIDSYANADASMKVLSPAFALAYGEADSVAKVNVNDATITAAGDITIDSQADTKLDVAAAAIHLGNNPLLAGASKYLDLGIAIADGSLDAQSTIGSSSVLTSTNGSIAINAKGNKNVSAQAKGLAYADGTAGAAFAVSIFTSTIESRIDGEAEALNGGLTVNATLDTVDNNALASAGAGTGYIGAVTKALSPDTHLLQGLSVLATRSGPKSTAGSAAPKFGLAASYLHIDHDNTVRSGIGAGGIVSTKNDVNIIALAEEGLSYRAGASVNGAKPGKDAKKVALSAAIANVDVDNKTEAFIDDNAVVNVSAGKIDVFAHSRVPIPWAAWDFSQVSDFRSGIDKVLDILSDPTLSTLTGITHSSADSDKFSLSGSFNILAIDNQANAWIGDNVDINKNQTINGLHDVSVRSLAEQETVNLAGQLTGGLLGMLKSIKGEGNGFGGAYVDTNFTGGADSSIGTGSEVYADNIDVTAETDIQNINITMSGGAAGKVSISGAVSLADIDTTTIAQIAADTTVNANNIVVAADDFTKHINVAGGVSKGNAGIGASVSVNTINRNVSAIMGNRDNETNNGGSITAAGNVLLDANTSGLVGSYSLAGGAAMSGKGTGPALFAGAGDVSVNNVTDITQAYINGGITVDVEGGSDYALDLTPADTSNDIEYIAGRGLELSAENSTNMDVFSGAVTLSTGPSNGLAGSFSFNDIAKKTYAHISNATAYAGDAIRLIANNTGGLLAIGASGSGSTTSKGLTVTGQYAQNDIDNEAKAYFDNSTVEIDVSHLAAVDQISLDAQDLSTIHAIAGAVTLGGKAGIGISFSDNSIDNTTQAYSKNSNVSTMGNFDLTALNDNEIKALAASLSITSSLSAAGSIATNSINNTASSYIDNSDLVDRSISIESTTTVSAEDDADIEVIVGSIGAAADAGLGASISTNKVSNTVEAYLNNVVQNNTGNNTIVTAEMIATIRALTGTVGASTKAAGVGAAVSVNRIANTVNAYTSGINTDLKLNNLSLHAASDADIETISIAFGGSKGVGVGGSVSTNFINNTVSSYIGGGADIVAENNVAVVAESDDRIRVASGGAGVGIAGAGIGVSIIVNEISGDTQAYISDVGTSVTAYAKDNADKLTVNDGQLDSSVNLAQQVDIATYNKLDLKTKKQTKQLNGLAVNAASSQHVEAIGVNIGAGTLGVALIEDINVITGTTKAYISQASINGSLAGAGLTQQVDINASNHAYINSFIGNLALGKAGVGVAEDLATISRGVYGYATASSIKSRDAFNVNALATQGISSLAVGGAGGVGGAFAGTGVLAQFQSVTQASLTDVDITADSVNVDAQSDDDMHLVAGGAAVSGGGAVGGSFTVGLNNSTTQAYIRGVNSRSKLNVQQDINVLASSNSNITNYSISAAAAGGIGVAGSVVTNIVTNTTEADIDKTDIGTAVSKANNVTIAANNTVDIKNRAGAGGGGIAAGVGAGAVVNILKSRTVADIQESSVYAQGLLDISANSQNNIDSLAVMVGVGKTAGIGGAVTVNMLGDNLSTESGEELDKGNNGTLTKVNNFTDKDRFAELQGSDSDVMTADEKTRLNDGAQGDVKDIANGNDAAQLQYQTAATIGSNVLVDAASVNVKAEDLTEIKSIVGAIGVGGVGIGGAVAISSVKANVNALVAETSDITTTGDITVSALVNRDAVDTVANDAWAGSAGIVGLGAAVSKVALDNTVNAGLAGDIKAGLGHVMVMAEDKSQTRVKALGAQAGALAVGAVVSRADKKSDINASISNSVTAANIDVTAKSNGAVYARSQASAGGIVSGAGADARANDVTAVSAVTAAGTVLNAAGGNINISADAQSNVEVVAAGSSLAFGANVGVSNAFAVANTDVDAYLAENNTVIANNLSVLSTLSRSIGRDSVKATAFGAGGGLLIGIGATNAGATNLSDIGSYIGNNSTLTISGATDVSADIDSKQYAKSDGYNGGVLALGFNNSRARSDTRTKAFLGTNVKVTGGNLAIFSGGEDNNYAEAVSGGGAVVGGSSSKASTTTTSDTQAYVSNGNASNPINVNNFSLEANHTATFNSAVNSSFGAVFGASGAYADNVQSSIVTANIGSNVAISANNIDINAKNIVRKNWLSGGKFNVISGSGGVIDAPAGKSITKIGLITKATVADNSKLIVEDGSGLGDLSISALNDVLAKDKVKLDSGGAIPIALVESKIINDTNDATVQVGNSEFRSSGDINLSTRSVADIKSQANAKTYGLAGAATGTTLSRVDADNKVIIKSGAYLRAAGDMKILAGRDKAGARNDFDVIARTDLWNKTAIPFITNPKADAKLTQNNRIVIESGTELGSVKDTYLLADEGNVFVEGKGIGKDAYREALAAVANAFRRLVGKDEISFDIHGGSTTNNSSSSVSNNGIVKAGIQNKQYLTIRTDGSVDTNDPQGQSDGVTFTRTQENISNNIDAQIAAYEQLKLDFSALPDVVAAYQAEIDRLNTQKAQLAGLDTNVGYINVAGIFAQSSNIHIKGDNLTGSGRIEAPGDTLIQIKNNSADFLRTDWLMIPENSGGRITFNDIQIHNNGDINARNQSGSAGFNNVLTSESSAAPLIRVENTYRPGFAGNPAGIEPDIEIVGDITNLRGTVEIINKAGSVNVSGNILANTIDIQAGKDLVLSYVDGFRHLGGDPKSHWSSIASASESSKVNRIVNGIRSGGSTLIAGNNIFASARILNINGLLQSGLPDGFINLATAPKIYKDFGNSSAGFDSLAWARNDYLTKVAGGQTPNEHYRIKASTGDTVDATYNAALDRIELQDVKVQGGFMQLFGQIVSTGAGELRVIDGYGRISVVNNSNKALVLNQLDVGVEREGQIKITDTNFRGFNNQPLTTWYRRLGNQISIWDSASLDVNGNPNNLVRMEAVGDKSTAYSPKAGQYFSWLRKDTTTKTSYRHIKEIKCFVVIDCSESKTTNTTSSTTAPIQIRDDLILFANDTADYRYKTSNVTNSNTGWRDDPNKTNSFNEYVIFSERHTYDRKIVKSSRYHQHNVKAFHDIDINFTGYDTAQLNVFSQGDLLINGGLSNNTGLTSLTSQGSIEQLTANASIGGHDINLLAGTGIGNNSVVKTNLGSGLLSAITGVGNISIEEILGDLNYANLMTNNGDINISVDGDLTRGTASAVIKGNKINLTSHYGDLGSSANRIVIDSGTNLANADGLTANAASNIYLTEQSGDLLIVSVDAKGGDANITVANGDLIDANLNETRDTRTEAELLSLWNDMLLVGTIGNDEESFAAQTIQGFENTKTSEYRLYWQARSRQANPSVYDASFSVVSNTAEVEAFKQQGWSNADIAAFDQKRTAQYHAKHNAYSSLGNAYNSAYRYQATSSDIAELSQGSVWTENQLKFALAGGLLKETSDTEVRIEEANISGLNVVLDVANNIGKSRADIVIDNTPAVLNLTDDQRIALASAEAGDIEITGTEIRIKQRDDVDIDALDSLNIVAGQNIYLGSEQDINIDQISSVSQGSVNIKTGQGIYNVANAGITNIISGDLILEAARGSIGSYNAPLSYESLTGVLTARSGNDIYLKNNGDMLVSTLFARNHIQLEANNIIDALNTDNINIRSKSLNLITTQSVGEVDNALDIALDKDGSFTAMIGASAGVGLNLLSPDRTLTLGKVQTNGDVAIEVRNGDLLAADDQLLKGHELTLSAVDGQVGSQDRSITADSNGAVSITAGTGIFYEDISDSLILRKLKTTTGPINLKTAGALSDDFELTNFSVDGLAIIDLAGYSIVIYDGPPRVFPDADVQLATEGNPINLTLRAGKRFIVTDALAIDYKPNYIVNRFSTENSLSLLGGKRTAQQMSAGNKFMSDELYQSLWGEKDPFDTFFDKIEGGAVIYDPELFVQATDEEDLFNITLSE